MKISPPMMAVNQSSPLPATIAVKPPPTAISNPTHLNTIHLLNWIHDATMAEDRQDALRRPEPGAPSRPILYGTMALLLERIDSGHDVISPGSESSDTGLNLDSGHWSQFYDGILRARRNAGPALVTPAMVYLGLSRSNRDGIL
jgi:hypothetical protein